CEPFGPIRELAFEIGVCERCCLEIEQLRVLRRGRKRRWLISDERSIESRELVPQQPHRLFVRDDAVGDEMQEMALVGKSQDLYSEQAGGGKIERATAGVDSQTSCRILAVESSDSSKIDDVCLDGWGERHDLDEPSCSPAALTKPERTSQNLVPRLQ